MAMGAKQPMHTAQSTISATADSQPRGSDPNVQEVIKTAHHELRNLIGQRAEIMRRIATLKNTICGLASLFGNDILDEDLTQLIESNERRREPGFTRICRMVLMESGAPISVREVCEGIRQREPAVMLRQKHPLASVTTVLNRLAEYGEVQRGFCPNGRTTWQWIGERPFPAELEAATRRRSVDQPIE